MSYRVVQKVNNNFYLYEVTSVWDPEKKKSKQYRKYLGKCDSDGNLLTPVKRRKDVEVTKTFGPYYLLHEIAKMAGVDSNLRKVFGENDAKLIMALALLRIVKPGPMRQVRDYVEESFVLELLDCEAEFDNASLSARLSNIGGSEELIKKFFRKSANDTEVTIFNLSYIGEHLSKESLYYCQECRTAKMPQCDINFVRSGKGELFLYNRCDGSPTAFSDFLTTESMVKTCGCNDPHYLIGTKSFSNQNIQKFLGLGMRFTVVVPMDSEVGKDMMLSASRDFFKKREAQEFNEYSVKVSERKSLLFGKRVRMIVLEEQEKRFEEYELFSHKLNNFELIVSQMNWTSDIQRELEMSSLSDMMGFFDLSPSVSGTVNVDRNNDVILDRINRFGKLLILTTSEESWDSLLRLCKDRDDLEYDVDIMMVDYESKVKYAPNPDAINGIIFVEFVSLMIKYVLKQKITSIESIKKHWVHDVIAKMNLLKISFTEDRWVLNEVTDEVRFYLDKLGVSVPDEMTM